MSCHEDAVAQLRQAGFRLTPQRVMVLDAIYHGRGHLTAEQVHERVVAKVPYVDLSTVYRTLQFLKQQGFIGELRLEGAAARYEAVRSGQEHHHALCTGCGAMIEVEPGDLASVGQALLQKYGFQVNPIHMIIRGLCAHCVAE